MWVAKIVFLCLCLVPSARAEDVPPVVMSWGKFPPLMGSNSDGAPVGFFIDLATRLAQIVEFDVSFQRYDSARGLLDAQATGTSQMLAGAATLPVLQDTNLFSDPVATTQVRLFINAVHADDPVFTDPTGKRIGVVPPSAGAQDSELLRRNQIVEFPDDASLLVELLRGGIDGAVLPKERLVATAHSIELDHRIMPVGEVILEFDRVVAVHESRAELMPAINAAIAKMEESGELAAMRERWFLEANTFFAGPLKVGVLHFPPYNIVHDDGTFSGFAVEHFRDLAELANMDIEFIEIKRPDLNAGPTANTYDAITLFGQNDTRKKTMDFTLTTETLEMAIFTKASNAKTYSDLASLGSDRVGVIHTNPALNRMLNGLNLTRYSSLPSLIAALDADEIEALLFPVEPLMAHIKAKNLQKEFQPHSPPFAILASSPALRRGLGSQREQLNAVIPGYLLSEDYRNLREKYFGAPVYWTRARIYSVIGAVAALFLCLIVYEIWQRQRQRHEAFIRQQRELEREQAFAGEQQKLVAELERSNRALDDFAYTASHDLKEPLRGIAINADFLAREDVSDKGRARLERMVALTKRMDQLISDILYFSRLGRGENVLKDVDPAQVIDRTGEELREWMAERNGKLRVATKLPWLRAESAKIKAVFQNLIVNGIKYNDSDEKTVEIGFLPKAEASGTTLEDVFYVRDNGIGIESKNHEKIFRIFNRLHREADYGPGTGAGLSFVRKIIEEYGKGIVLVSDPGQGTTFFFSLPHADTENS